MNKLFTLRNTILAASMTLTSFVSVATDTTSWDFTTNSKTTSYGGYSNNYDGNELDFSESGVNLSVSAWSDTKEISGDDAIETATVGNNKWGLLNENQNADSHYVDNANDYDMLLFSFDEFVTITDINIYTGTSDSDISIAAFDSLPTLEGETWAEVVSNAIFSTSFSDIGTGWSSLESETATYEAQYWLIGAYNSEFGSIGKDRSDDYLKIAGITTVTGEGPDPKPPTDVAEPSSLAVLASFGLFAFWRRRKTA
jgi:hypothetical protein